MWIEVRANAGIAMTKMPGLLLLAMSAFLGTRVGAWPRDAHLSHSGFGGLSHTGSDGSHQNILDADIENHQSRPLKVVQGTTPVVTPWGLVVEDHLIEPREHPLQSWTMELVDHSFGNSYGQPFVGSYQPPPPSCFNRAYMNMTVVSEGHQFDRLATMWLNDTEIFRTSTAEPRAHPGIAWSYLKDMTAYMSLWRRPQTVIFDLGNLLNDKYTGRFNVTITLTLFCDQAYQPTGPPADVILPISNMNGAVRQSSAFNFPEEQALATLNLPKNVNRAVLSVAATAQGEDEFWWSNVPESDAGFFHGKDGDTLPGKGSFREVRLRIDGHWAGLVWPFPVVFTGGIAPPLHRPIVSPETFDLREFEIDVTPWLGLLCDGLSHSFSLEVLAIDDSQPEPQLVTAPSRWVLSGKIFLWLDSHDSITLGTKPEVKVEPLIYWHNAEDVPEKDLVYQQYVNRDFTSSATIWTQEGTQTLVWRQNFGMKNEGVVRDSGRSQTVDASYTGNALSTKNGSPVYSNSFAYPMEAAYHYKSPEGDHTLEVEAQLNQTFGLKILGRTPYSTGIEAFFERLQQKPVGVTISTTHRANATFFVFDDGKQSGGSSNIALDYKLGSVKDYHQLGPHTVPPEVELYARYLDAADDAIRQDEQFIMGQNIRSAFTQRDLPYSKETGDFAPRMIHELVGTKVFRRENFDSV